MESRITGLHHVTATVDDPKADVAFYAGLLGLRLVKRTVNFDNTGVYHFYYGDARGSPGTIMTTFPYGGMGVPAGRKGTGQVAATAFSAPAGALDFWRSRLWQAGFPVREGGERFGEEVVVVEDPSGLVIELVGTDDDWRTAWVAEDVDAAVALRGVHSVTLQLRELQPSRDLLEGILELERIDEDADRVRIGVRHGKPGQILDLEREPAAPAGANGLGTVHHVALAVGTDDDQLALQEELRRVGFQVSDVRDRQYFRSIYFREPGGVLLEVATEEPGFLIDEAEYELGRTLKLPPWEESVRDSIEAALPDVD